MVILSFFWAISPLLASVLVRLHHAEPGLAVFLADQLEFQTDAVGRELDPVVVKLVDELHLYVAQGETQNEVGFVELEDREGRLVEDAVAELPVHLRRLQNFDIEQPFHLYIFIVFF